MIYTKFKKNLTSLPVLNQTKNTLHRYFPILFTPSKEYNYWANFISDSEYWNNDQLKNYQWNKTKELLKFSYESIPYYQRIFKEIGAKPEDILTEKDFNLFPILTKEIVRENVDDLLPIGIDRNKLIKYNSGGSTGIPLPIYKTRIDDIIEDAFMNNQWKRVGYKNKDSRVILRGEVIEENKLWKYQPNYNAWIFSSYHLSDDYIKLLINKLNKIKPLFLHVYPSSLWVLANLIKKNKLKLDFKPKAILCGSEKLFDHQRELFYEIFGCRSYSWLGLAEQTILAGECEHNKELHIFPQHSYVELIDNDGKVIKNNGITGHIVGTTLHRNTFPFIRYISGDMAQYSPGNCNCGRNYQRFKQVEGRVQNMIVSQDSRIIPLTALVFGQHLLAFNKIEKMQLFQCEKGIVEVRLIKGLRFTDEDVDILRNQLSKATNNKVEFNFSFHENLERTATGKHKFLIQELPIEFYNFDQNGH
ncbi:MAG: phenylacetate--CoA ligase family protein [Bacteroidetes bacterium]|nr:phenylacetate--CoA ligase family protein [Bacteroidota bacterium]